MEINLMYLPDL